MFEFVKLAKDNTFSDRTRNTIADLRAHLMPADDDPFMTVPSVGALGLETYSSSTDVRNTLNPTPYEVIKKSTSGFLSFHHTPYEDFFKTRLILPEKSDKVLLEQSEEYWRWRDKRNHDHVSQARNVVEEALFIMSRIVFNIGAKTLDYDKVLTVKKKTYPVESACLFSSDGQHLDIQGVCESLTWFQYRTRFPNPMFPRKEGQDQIAQSYDFTRRVTQNTTHSHPGDVMVFRFNVPIEFMKDYLRSYFLSQGKLSSGEEILDIISNDLSNKHDVLDFWVDQEGNIISLTGRNYRTIIIGHLGFITKDGVRGKSQGDMMLSTAKSLQEAEEILVEGFERKFGPAWAFPTELERRAYKSLSRNDVIYVKPNQADGLRPLTVQTELREAKELILAWEERLATLGFLDVFNLINKSRMPVPEIAMRREDGFRQMGLFIAADTAYNLEPEIATISRIDEEHNKLPEPPQMEGSTKVGYISPLIKAMRASALDEASRLLDVMAKVESVAEGESKKNMLYGQLVRKTLDKTDNIDLRRELQETNNIERQEAAQKTLDFQHKMAQTREAQSGNLSRLQELGDRDGERPGTGAGQLGSQAGNEGVVP